MAAPRRRRSSSKRRGASGVRIDGPNVDGLADEIAEDLFSRAEAGVTRAAEALVAQVKRNLGFRVGAGRPYRLEGRRYQASAPGQYPIRVLGELQNSFSVQRVRRYKRRVRAFWGSKHPSAGVLEFGGRVGKAKRTRILPRPYIRPAEAAMGLTLDRILDGTL